MGSAEDLGRCTVQIDRSLMEPY